MTENEISELIIGKCIKVHRYFGPGLFESVYEEALCYELCKDNIYFERQKPIEVEYEGIALGKGFIADIIIEEKVIIEIKSVKQIEAVFQKQLLTYLKLTEIKLGLLINFNEVLLKNGISRIVNNLY